MGSIITKVYSIGDRIKSVRKEKGMSQRELAELLNVKQPQIVSWEKGKREPGMYNVAKIADALKVDISSLTGVPALTDAEMDVLITKIKKLPPTKQKFILQSIDLIS